MTDLERDLVTAALTPFAMFVMHGIPDDHVITEGSQLAKRQLTMGDCRVANRVLKAVLSEQEHQD